MKDTIWVIHYAFAGALGLAMVLMILRCYLPELIVAIRQTWHEPLKEKEKL